MDIQFVESALSYIPSHERDLWLKIGMALKSEYSEAGFEIWDEWSRTSHNYNESDTKTVWRSFDASGGITIGTLIREAKLYGFKTSNLKQNFGKKIVLRISDKKFVAKGLNFVTNSVPAMEQPLPLEFANKNENGKEYIDLLPDSVYEYRNFNGQLLGYIYRYEVSTLQKADSNVKKKANLPISLCSDGNFYTKGLPAYPFYGSERVSSSNGNYLIHEGEKCCDLANKIFPSITSLTAQGGADGLSKLLLEEETINALKIGRNFILMDKDVSGIRYAKNLKALLEAQGVTVTVLSIRFIEQRLGITLEDGADVEQLIEAGLTEDILLEWMSYEGNNRDFNLCLKNKCSKQEDGDVEKLKEKEKPVYISKLIISKIDTSFNEKSTNSSYLKLSEESRFYKCGSDEFYVKIVGIYSEIFGESTNKYREISKLVEHYLKDEKNKTIWVEASKPVYFKDGKVYFKTDLKNHQIYEIDSVGFRVSNEKDYCAYKIPFAKDTNEIVFKLADECASIQELELFFTVKGIDLVKILAFCISSILSDEKYILGIFGAFSSGKDYVQTRINEIISPLESFNRLVPRNPKDLMVVSSQTFINAYTNVSYLSKDFQDYFCSLVGDVADPSRKLFSDNSVVDIRAKTPIIINGINNVVERPDLFSRMMVINLEAINSANRVKFTGSREDLKALQGKVQHFVFKLISKFITNMENVIKLMIGKGRTEKILAWMELCTACVDLNISIDAMVQEQERQELNNILENPIFMAIESYFIQSGNSRLSGSVSEVWRVVNSYSDLGYLKNIGANGFMKEMNRIDFTKSSIKFINAGRPRVNGVRRNQICLELEENNNHD